MSDQSPWGTTPTPPPSGSGPTPYGAPGQAPYPPPQKSHTGLIIGLTVGGAVVLLLVIGGVLLALGAISGGGDGEVSASPVTTATSDESTPDTVPDEDAVQGTGYTYQLPGTGWTDVSDDAGDLGPTIDSISILGGSIETAQSNILIETGPSGSADLSDLEPAWQRNISGPDKAPTEPIDDTTIGGEPAVGVSVERTNGAGVPITQVAYLTVHDGNQFSIALSFPSDGDDVSQDDFETALASWSWTS